MRSQTVWCFILWGLFGVNLLVTLKLTQFSLTVRRPRKHTYIGNDYPLDFQMGRLDDVAIDLHESVHFVLNISDIVADKEWHTLDGYPRGLGRAHLGPDKRVFNIAFYHQLHCIRTMQLAILQNNHPHATLEHIQHCLNYLRQTFLCVAAATLEPEDFMKHNYDFHNVGGTGNSLVCRDWEKVYEGLGNNYDEWIVWKAQDMKDPRRG